MNRSHPSLLRRVARPWAVVLLLTLCGFVYQSYAVRNAVMQPSVVAVVDIEKLFDALDEKKAADEELADMAEQLNKEDETRVADIERLEQDLALFPEGSDKAHEVLSEMKLKALQYRTFHDFSRMRIDAIKGLRMAGIYRNIRKAAAEYASANGIDLVFVDDSVNDIPNGGQQEVMQHISGRRLLYASEVVDITEDLTAKMNGDFALRNANAAAADGARGPGG